jgi:hypothetical protein
MTIVISFIRFGTHGVPSGRICEKERKKSQRASSIKLSRCKHKEMLGQIQHETDKPSPHAH